MASSPPDHEGHQHGHGVSHSPGGSHEPPMPAEPGYPHHPESGDAGIPRRAGGRARPPGHAHAEHGHAAREHGGHDKHAGHSVAMFRDKFWIALALTIPTLVWGHMLQMALGYRAPAFPGAHWIPAAFGTAVFLYGGLVFLRGALGEIRARLPGMMTLISLAITVAFVFSAAVALGYRGMPLWEELATLVTIMLLGHWLEMRSISQAQGALNELAKLLPGTAIRVRSDGGTDEVPLDEIREGDVVLVRPGQAVPADGTVRDGQSEVDEASITGESRPVPRTVGERVIAGTINGSGSLRVQITAAGDRTALAGIMRLVAQAQASRSRAQALADRAAFWLTWIALAAGAVTFIAWKLLGAETSDAVERLVTVLVIACPHALGLAVPLVIAISTTLGARNGLLVRDRRGLEEARLLDAVVFDKTGTLTLGEHRVVDVVTTGDMTADEALRLAAALERDSEHSVARAIVASAEERGLAIPSASQFTYVAGRGVSGVVEGRRLAGGGPNLLGHLGAPLGAAMAAARDSAASAGQGVIYLFEDDRPVAAFTVADAVRPESREAVRSLHATGIEVVMLTGDASAVAQAVARELEIDTVYSQVLPADKAARIGELQRQGKRVAMVGDGVNDAPALVQADVGIAIGAGTDVAVEAGDVVLVRSDPRDVARIVTLSRATYRKMIQNLWWAAGYNIVAIPLAAGVLAPWGFVLSPAVGAVLMSLSTIIVAVNAQLLRRTSLA